MVLVLVLRSFPQYNGVFVAGLEDEQYPAIMAVTSRAFGVFDNVKK